MKIIKSNCKTFENKTILIIKHNISLYQFLVSKLLKKITIIYIIKMEDIKSEMQVIKTELFNNKNTIRICGTFENPYFIVKDVLNVLGLTNTNMSLKNIPQKYLK